MANTRALARGHIRIEVRDAHTGVLLHTQHVHNLLTEAGASLIRDALAGVAGAALTYIAYGTGTTPPTRADTTLEVEEERDTLTALTVTDPGKLVCEHYLDTTAANGHTLTEIGLYGGATASSTPDSGSLYSRAILSTPIIKTSDIACTVWWELTWEGR